jgi:hypothetical protein
MPAPRWTDEFANPSSKYRTMPQWSWNGEMTEQRIREQLDQFHAQGCGGFFPHARPGHITGYITDRWFELWDYACRYAKSLGMEFHIYDEFCCPGGNAGGVVVQRHPELAQREVSLRTVYDPAHVTGADVLACLAAGDDGVPQRLDDEAWKNAAPQSPVRVVTMSAPKLGRTFAAADLLLPQTATTFLETTHDRYAAYTGDEFGKSVRFMFCDEPHVTAPFWAMSPYLLKEFRFEHGYDLVDEIHKLIFTQDGSPEVRYDYFQTVNRLFIDNFMKPLHDWCEQHDLLFTGHLIENTFPRPKPQPDNMAALRWMQAPGNDLLGFQFAPTTPEDNALYFYNLREMTSIANQCDREWRLVESAGAPGYQASFEVFKPCEDYLLALGTNVMDPHLAHQTLAGIRKYDWPHTLSDHSPWWDHYHNEANHVGRTNAALCQGAEVNRIGVLHPATSTWLHWENPTGEQKVRRPPHPEPIAKLGEEMFALALKLYGGQMDFDLISEFVLAEMGQPAEGKLEVGACTYEVVVVPACMETWTTGTLQMMEHYLAGGGKILALGEAPARIDGRPSSEPADLADRWSDQWIRFESIEALRDHLRQMLGPVLSAPDSSALPDQLCWRRTLSPDGERIYFFANPWAEAITCDVLLPGKAAFELNTADGSIEPAPLPATDEGLTLQLSLPPRSHRLVVVSDTPHEQAPEKPAEPTATRLEPEFIKAEATDVNRLIVDYCDVRALTGQELLGAPTAVADQTNWRWQGFEGNAWRKQVARNVADKPVDANTGFIVAYRFTVQPDVPADLLKQVEIAVERPWLYEVALNDQALDVPHARRWFDEDMRTLETGGALRTGENTLTLKAQPFQTLCEIMPIYILGPVSVQPAAKGWTLAAPEKLTLGDWTRQGWPFYPAGVRYDFRVKLDDRADSLRIQLNNWNGSVAVVNWRGKSVGDILHPPFALEIPGPIEPGDHTVGIEVLGNVRNMMGPHFGSGLTGPWAYEAYPMTQPAGDEYKLIPTGLFEPATIEALNR